MKKSKIPGGPGPQEQGASEGPALPGSSRRVPVVVFIFNRPENTRRVLERIASARPSKLFVIADGPRANHPDDAGRCEQTRTILNTIDWPCEVWTNFASSNLGLVERLSSGFDWVFKVVDRAVFLEDDCIPDPSFFRFCAELLDRYEDEPRIRTIAGSNFLEGRTRSSFSYHYSHFHSVWGWAMWRRSWHRTDMQMRHWPHLRDAGWLLDVTGSRQLAKFWGPRFNNTYEGRISSWAYPYQLSCWLDGCLAITPNCNLISNIGFGSDATHTSQKKSYLNQSTQAMCFPLHHPPCVIRDRISDSETFKRRFLPEKSHWTWYAARRAYYFLSGKPHIFSLKLNTVELTNHTTPEGF